MNAAARMIHQTTLFNGQWADLEMSRMTMLILTVLFAVLMTGLAVTYTTNAYRLTLSQVEQNRQQKNTLDLQWGQLLLEQASLATPARVEQLATAELNMSIPQQKHILVLRKE